MRASGRLRLYYPNHHFVGLDRKQVQHQWLPRRLLLVRHGESEANVDREVYSNTPDWRIALTERGRDQAYDCGRRLRRIIGDDKIYVYYSPYARTRQTLEEIRKSLDVSQIQGEREDERLREQEMGNYQPMADMDDTWAARNKFSRLYFRFPSGESSADVGDRVSGFFDSLLRERIGLTVPNMNERMLADASEEVAWLGLGKWHGTEKTARGSSSGRDGTAGSAGVGQPGPSPRAQGDAASADSSRPVSALASAADRGVLPPNDLGAAAGDDQNVIIVAHGLLLRLFVGRWFRVPMEVLETMRNPPNCAIVVLERDDAIGRLVMTDTSKQLFGSDPLLQMMRFDGREDTQWYRERFLGIIDADKSSGGERLAEDDDENHYSRSLVTPDYEPPASLRDNPPVQRPRPTRARRSPPPPPPAAAAPTPAAAAATTPDDSADMQSTAAALAEQPAVADTPVATAPSEDDAALEDDAYAQAMESAETRERLRQWLSRGFWD